MCKGFSNMEQKRELREWKRIRSIGWTVLCGYADPKKLPKNQSEWWPMDGDELLKLKPQKLTKARVKKIEDLAAIHLAKLNGGER